MAARTGQYRALVRIIESKMANDDSTSGQILQFPCSFPVKMMGRDTPDFRQTVIDIITRHAGSVSESDVRIAPSSKGTFVSVTVTIQAVSQDQLDNIYRELTEHEDVLVGL